MAKFKKMAFDLGYLNPNKLLDTTPTEWFAVGEKVEYVPDLSSFDFRKNMSTGEIDEEALQAIKEKEHMKGEVLEILKTENGLPLGKPSEILVKLEDGTELRGEPLSWYKKVDSSLKEVGSDITMSAITNYAQASGIQPDYLNEEDFENIAKFLSQKYGTPISGEEVAAFYEEEYVNSDDYDFDSGLRDVLEDDYGDN